MIRGLKPSGKWKLFPPKRVLLVLAFFAFVVAAMGYGMICHKYKLFPYNEIKKMYHRMKANEEDGPWAIGIYEGKTPFELKPADGVSNPVLFGKDCDDANFVADPFMIRKDGRYYMFFERVGKDSSQGDIAYAESSDCKGWEYKKVVIDEDFHLSYPNVFEWKGEYYIILESHQDLSVRLYKAESFPTKWRMVKKILSGYSFVDPSVFRYNNKWWVFLTTPASNILNLYYSDDLMGKWKRHPMNPLIKFNKHISRPGGRVIIYKGKPYRFAQDDKPFYGVGVYAFEITELTEKTYKEKPVSSKHILSGSGHGWNSVGMHHVDLHKMGGKWIAVVDGRNREED